MIRSIFFGFMTGKPYTLHLKPKINTLNSKFPLTEKWPNYQFQLIEFIWKRSVCSVQLIFQLRPSCKPNRFSEIPKKP